MEIIERLRGEVRRLEAENGRLRAELDAASDMIEQRDAQAAEALARAELTAVRAAHVLRDYQVLHDNFTDALARAGKAEAALHRSREEDRAIQEFLAKEADGIAKAFGFDLPEKGSC
jgi:hypothetical protein